MSCFIPNLIKTFKSNECYLHRKGGGSHNTRTHRHRGGGAGGTSASHFFVNYKLKSYWEKVFSAPPPWITSQLPPPPLSKLLQGPWILKFGMVMKLKGNSAQMFCSLSFTYYCHCCLEWHLLQFQCISSSLRTSIFNSFLTWGACPRAPLKHLRIKELTWPIIPILIIWSWFLRYVPATKNPGYRPVTIRNT